MNYNQNIILDLNTDNSYVIVGAKQGDTGRKITANIVQDGQPLDLSSISSNLSATYRVGQPNGGGTWASVTSISTSAAGTVVVIDLRDVDLGIPGRNIVDILLRENTAVSGEPVYRKISTVNFVLNVMAAPNIAAGAIKSEPFQYLEEIVEASETADYWADQAHMWANGKATGAGTPSATNNSMYYANQAKSSEIAAESAKETAETVKQDVLELVEELDEEYGPQMVVGTAEQLTTEHGIDADAVYSFRKTGGATAVGNRDRVKIDKITGGTVVWNQLIQNGNFADGTTSWSTSNATISVSNGILSSTATAQNGQFYQSSREFINGHVYILLAQFKASASTNLSVYNGKGLYFDVASIGTSFAQYSSIRKNNKTTGTTSIIFQNSAASDWKTVQTKNVMLIDLTSTFGTTIADYLYSLETATAGAGIAKLLSWGFDVNTYHAYAVGSLQSVCTSGHRMVGFNVWDEEWEVGGIDNVTGQNDIANNRIRSKNYIPVFPNTAYYCKGYSGDMGVYGIFMFDADKNYLGYNVLTQAGFTTSMNCRFIRFRTYTGYGATYKHDICINLSDPDKNGTYEPYDGHLYPIDPVELRGIPKLDANNELYYDGDTYLPSGQINRRYGVVDLGTLTWSEYGSTENYTRYVTAGIDSLAKIGGGVISPKFVWVPLGEPFIANCINLGGGNGRLTVTTSVGAYASVAAFKTAMLGVMATYELATPTTESATPYSSVQICHSEGTEQFIDAGTRDIAIPVQVTQCYMMNVTANLDKIIGNVDIRENDNRQVLLGTVMDVAKDSYSELRSAPVHTQLIQNGTTFSRIDKTSLELSAIKGKTVAFNQLVPSASSSTSIGSGLTESAQDANGKRTISGTRTNSNWASGSNMEFNCFKNHVYMVCANGLKAGASHTSERYLSLLVGWSQFLNFTPSATAAIVKPSSDGTYRFAVGGSTNDVMNFSYIPFAIDLTQMYGTTLADSIYAMEQATPGSGVAYVRQRMPLDYYAPNAGELTAPVVSGWEVTGFNQWDEEWELGSIDGSTGENTPSTNTIRSKNYTKVISGQNYYFCVPGSYIGIRYYDANKNYISGGVVYNGSTITMQNNISYIRFMCPSTYGTTYKNDICINLSDPSRNGEYEPYQHPSLPIPSTTLNGVGTAQDWLEVVEDGENDYSLHLHTLMGEVDLGTLTWTYDSNNTRFFATVADAKEPNYDTLISTRYEASTNPITTHNIDKQIASYGGRFYLTDFSYTDAASLKAALNGVILCYEKTTPTQTTIAEHLTLAEVSAIAENGGIISIVNSNGDIVQPDLELDGFKIDTITPALNEKAPINSPAFTGIPTAPTPSATDNTTKLSTTAFVHTAVNAEKTRAMAAEALKADKSYADYILLREEEDRQILFGSIVQAAEDEYDELRSAPIHNAITIGQSVYPRMDNTRMAIDRMLGRTVAFNQLLNPYNSSGTDVGVTWSAVDGEVTFSATSATAQKDVQLTARPITFREGHKYLLVGFSGGSGSTWRIRLNTFGLLFSEPTIISQNASADSNVLIRVFSGATFASKTIAPNVIDLTAMYGTTLADSIYAMEQATPGAGVAYVRQRMPLDYYAYNAGELKAPVVSGFTVTGKNLIDFDEGVQSNSNIRWGGTNYADGTLVLKAGTYTFSCKNTVTGLYVKDANGSLIAARYTKQSLSFTLTATQPVLLDCYDANANGVWTDYDFQLEIGSSATAYEPYSLTTLPLPSTRLDGVGTAQDTLYMREDGENDYSLIKRSVMGLVDLGDLDWNADTNRPGVFYSSTNSSSRKPNGGIMSAQYVHRAGFVPPASGLPDADKSISLAPSYGEGRIYIIDLAKSSMTATQFKEAVTWQNAVFELATPTETVIASHLTLAEVSAIAQNGGIVSIINSNGDIVQPDAVFDTVISRSAQ